MDTSGSSIAFPTRISLNFFYSSESFHKLCQCHSHFVRLFCSECLAVRLYALSSPSVASFRRHRTSSEWLANIRWQVKRKKRESETDEVSKRLSRERVLTLLQWHVRWCDPRFDLTTSPQRSLLFFARSVSFLCKPFGILICLYSSFQKPCHSPVVELFFSEWIVTRLRAPFGGRQSSFDACTTFQSSFFTELPYWAKYSDSDRDEK